MKPPSLRTVGLVFVSMAWGAALYVAVFSSSPPGYLEGQGDNGDYQSDTAERRFVADGGGRERQVAAGEGKKRHLNGAAEWVPAKPPAPPPPRVPGADFTIHEPFHFPLPHYSRDKLSLLASPWVTQLRTFLRGVRGTQISMVTASVEHRDVLLNWLISATLVAHPPLPEVLVLTLDHSVFQLTSTRNISTLFVSQDMVIRESAGVTRRFSQVHVVRLSVLRLLNHYGFSVVNYDCDAILLKNPQSIFDGHKDADIIGTFGKGPGQLYVKWGITLNTGVMLLRSNPKTGECVCVGACVSVWG